MTKAGGRGVDHASILRDQTDVSRHFTLSAGNNIWLLWLPGPRAYVAAFAGVVVSFTRPVYSHGGKGSL
ncbi:hypothetical protein [Chitinophaga barathri]|uniref:hypothetical protein n=1 Tax=Chitinophaga barathri TaxID=1647451 RepID=UPI0013C4C200|nr:hypothetical protein [Chitinophaga barathri]